MIITSKNIKLFGNPIANVEHSFSYFLCFADNYLPILWEGFFISTNRIFGNYQRFGLCGFSGLRTAA